MPIVVHLDVMLAKRKMRSRELAEHVGITEQNISLLKSGKVRGVRFDTLEQICQVLQVQARHFAEAHRQQGVGCREQQHRCSDEQGRGQQGQAAHPAGQPPKTISQQSRGGKGGGLGRQSRAHWIYCKTIKNGCQTRSCGSAR